jgi:hypothetical protein
MSLILAVRRTVSGIYSAKMFYMRALQVTDMTWQVMSDSIICHVPLVLCFDKSKGVV